MTFSNDSDSVGSHTPSIPDSAELIDEVVLAEDILDDEGNVIGEHIEVIDLLDIDGEGVVIIDDVTIVTDEEGDILIEETIAVFDESGDVILDETNVIIDAEGDIMITEHVVAVDAEGNAVELNEVIVIDGGEVDERAIADSLRRDLDGVEDALGRLDAGTYGVCDSCGNQIEDDVLAENPQSHRCGAHLL